MHPKAEALVAFADSEPAPERSRSVARHLETCAKCRERLRRIEDEKVDLGTAAGPGPQSTPDAREGLAAVFAAIGEWRQGAASAASPRLRRRVRDGMETYFGKAAASLAERPEIGPDEMLARALALATAFLGPDAADAVMNGILEGTR